MTATAFYVRQSEDKTGHAAAVERQAQDCRKLADAKGWPEPEGYEDNSISATSGRTRPDFERLLHDIEAGKVDRVAVWHLDRLTRSMRDLTRIIEAGRKHRVNIACVHGVSLDLGDPTGVAVAQILTAIAAMETAHKGERQKRANRQRAEKGRAFWTRRPFGYNRDENGQVHVVTAEADAIRDGAAKVLAGATLASVARAWNAAGLLTTYTKRDPETGLQAEGGKPWGVTQVRRVLLNPRYAGRGMYNGEPVHIEGEDGELVPVEGLWEPVLTAETQRDLENLLTDPRRRTAPADLNAKYLLAGIARCGKCSGPMYPSMYRAKGREVMVYRCQQNYCLQRRAADVEAVVEAVMLARLALPDAASVFGPGVDSRELRATAAAIRDRRDALAALLAEGLLSPSAVREQSAKLTADLTRAEDAVTAAESVSPLSGILAADDVRAAWDGTPMAARRQIVRALADVTVLPAGKGVRFAPDQVHIAWRGLA